MVFRMKVHLPDRPAVVEACIVLALFVAGMVSTAAGEFRHSADSAEQTSQSDGHSCPDPSDEGGPCSPSCQCTCCPGHWTGAPLLAVGLSLDTPVMDEIEHSLPDDLHPQDAINRIFHPPRA